jgi:hypothetical protein
MSFEVFVEISEFEIFKVEKAAKRFCENKSFPPELLYIDYKMEDQTLYFLEIRPKWNDPTKKTETLVAKFMYIKKNKVWKLYWPRQNSKWKQYEPNGVNQHLEPLFKILSEDLTGCFYY